MSAPVHPSCPLCGEPLAPGAGECPRHGGAAAGEGPPERTQTILPALPKPDGDPEAPSEPGSAAPQPGPPEALIGQQLGDYVVRRYIGSGGMGIVYEGEHLTIGSKVAIKFIREELTRGPHARALLTEARAASAIRHHGIIDIFGFGQQPGLGQYLVMEYLAGRPLDQVLRERAPLPYPEALALLCEVLDALSAAHAAGVIHRDLKPSNIFIVRQSNGTEHVKVLDFGLAKRTTVPNGTTAQTHSNLIVGTPQYMAPEQALGEAVGPQTDLYSVGVIAFELLTGQRPFPGRSHMEVVIHHLQTPPPVPSSLVPLPAEVDEFILQLLTKQPLQRPSSATAVSRTLRALLQPREGANALVPRLSPLGTSAPPASERVRSTTPTVTLSPAPQEPQAGQPAPEPAPRQPRFVGWQGALLAAVTLLLGLAASRLPSTQWRLWETPLLSAEPLPPPAKQVYGETGLLVLKVNAAWAEVWVDGQKLGYFPQQDSYLLPVGGHQLELRNPAFAPYLQKITILPGARLTQPVDFSPLARPAMAPAP